MFFRCKVLFKKGKLIIVFLLKAGYFYVCVKSLFFKVDIYLIYATKLLNVKNLVEFIFLLYILPNL